MTKRNYLTVAYFRIVTRIAQKYAFQFCLIDRTRRPCAQIRTRAVQVLQKKMDTLKTQQAVRSKITSFHTFQLLTLTICMPSSSSSSRHFSQKHFSSSFIQSTFLDFKYLSANDSHNYADQSSATACKKKRFQLKSNYTNISGQAG